MSENSDELCFYATKRGHIVPSWKRRYFVCTTGAMTIRYWETKAKAKAGDVASVKGQVAVHTIESNDSMVSVRGQDDSELLLMRMESPEAAEKLLSFFEGYVSVVERGTAGRVHALTFNSAAGPVEVRLTEFGDGREAAFSIAGEAANDYMQEDMKEALAIDQIEKDERSIGHTVARLSYGVRSSRVSSRFIRRISTAISATTSPSLASFASDVPLNVTIVTVGSRGDVQPFIALGLELVKQGHTVRLGAHACFEDFVKKEGKDQLEFYPLAGDPKELMAMMTEHDFLSYGFIKETFKTQMPFIRALLLSAWDCCTSATIVPRDKVAHATSANSAASANSATTQDSESADADKLDKVIVEEDTSTPMKDREFSYTPDLIIGNPPSFACPHIAEALDLPLVMAFTMPWSRTRAFGSPFFQSTAISSGAAKKKTGQKQAKSAPLLNAASCTPLAVPSAAEAAETQPMQKTRATSNLYTQSGKSLGAGLSNCSLDSIGESMSSESSVDTTSNMSNDSAVAKAVDSNSSGGSAINYMSFLLVERVIWLGLAGIINNWRTKTLALPTLSLNGGHAIVTQRRIPHLYCYSEALLAKPNDWGDNIDVCGFWFLPQDGGSAEWEPPAHLAKFLGIKAQAAEAAAVGSESEVVAATSDDTTSTITATEAQAQAQTVADSDIVPPIFISFGSIVIKDPEALNKAVFEALWQLSESNGGQHRKHARVIIQAGWAKLGNCDHVAGEKDPRKRKFWEENVCVIGRAPHDWVFGRVSAVVHHGGAGTTAAGLRAGKPTVILPFFGDQYFWGSTVERMGLGAFLKDGVPKVSKTPEYLVEALKTALAPLVQENARRCGARIRSERGTANAVEFLKDQVALWKERKQEQEWEQDLKTKKKTSSKAKTGKWSLYGGIRRDELCGAVLGDGTPEYPGYDPVVYENQRYSPVFGWGNSYPGHLLPTDRGPFSNRSGGLYCTTMATSVLEEWGLEVDKTVAGADEEGWEYATRFLNFGRSRFHERLPSQRKKLATSVVRRRKWVVSLGLGS